MADFGADGHGPYPDSWSDNAIRLWESEPQTYREYYDSDEEWQDLQAAFDLGWIVVGISREEHETGRQQFYDISGTQESSFDWAAFREFLREEYQSG